MKYPTPATGHPQLQKLGRWLLFPGLLLFLIPVMASGQEALWKTYFDAGRKAYDQAEKDAGSSKESRRAAYADAQKRFELARSEAESFAAHDPRRINTLYWLVSTYFAEGNFDAADPIAKQLLAVWRAQAGPYPRSTVISQTILGNRYYSRDLYDDAEKFYDLALSSVANSAPGSQEYKDMLELRYDLSGVYLYQKKADACMRILSEVREPAVKELGKDALLVGKIDGRLGLAYAAQGKYADAETSYRNALRIFLLEKESGWFFGALDNLNGMFRSRGEYAASEKLLKPIVTALDNDKGLLREFAKYANALGLAYQFQEKFEEAVKTFERVRDVYKEIRTPDHEDQGTIRNNIAKAYYYLRKYKEAEQLYLEAIDISKRANGADNLDAVWYEKNYALLLYARGEKERADELFQKAITKFSANKGSELSVATSWFELGELYRRQERFAGAEPLLKQALETRQKFLEPDHLDLALTMERYAMTLRMLKRQAEALKLEEQAMAIRSKHAGEK